MYLIWFFNLAQVSTYAGVCTHKGFKDGPLGINRFNEPDGIGVDEDGNLIVFDSKNNYLRLIDTNGFVSTLINGACYEYDENKLVFNNKHLICFKFFFFWNLGNGLKILGYLINIFILRVHRLSV